LDASVEHPVPHHSGELEGSELSVPEYYPIRPRRIKSA
jgi:hypothetical protein